MLPIYGTRTQPCAAGCDRDAAVVRGRRGSRPRRSLSTEEEGTEKLQLVKDAPTADFSDTFFSLLMLVTRSNLLRQKRKQKRCFSRNASTLRRVCGSFGKRRAQSCQANFAAGQVAIDLRRKGKRHSLQLRCPARRGGDASRVFGRNREEGNISKLKATSHREDEDTFSVYPAGVLHFYLIYRVCPHVGCSMAVGVRCMPI